MFAIQMLAQQVECLGLPNKQAILTRFQEAFRTMWAQNGDHISRIYVGTGTLDGKARVSLYVVREGSFSFGQRVSKSIPHLFLLWISTSIDWTQNLTPFSNNLLEKRKMVTTKVIVQLTRVFQRFASAVYVYLDLRLVYLILWYISLLLLVLYIWIIWFIFYICSWLADVISLDRQIVAQVTVYLLWWRR